MKNQALPMKNQSGSVIIWILVLIALFGALSFVISRGNRTGAGQLTEQKAKLAATEMIEYADLVRRTVQTMVINGIPLNNLDFSMYNLYNLGGANLPNLYNNSLCTSNACKVFSPAGGGLTPRQFYAYGKATPVWTDPTLSKPGSVSFGLYRVEGFGTSASEILMRISVIHPDICAALNKMADVQGSVSPSGSNNVRWGDPIDTKMADTTTYVYGISSPQLASKSYFCTNNDYFANFLIIAR